MSLKRQHFLLNYLKALSVGPAGFKPATSRSADRRSPNSANQAAVNIVLARIRVDTNGHNFLNNEIVHRVLPIINNRWSIFASI